MWLVMRTGLECEDCLTETGLRYVQDTGIIMKGFEEPVLYTESRSGSYRLVLALSSGYRHNRFTVDNV